MKKKNSKIKYTKLNNFWEIRKGPICNEYERKNIGSHPSKFDILIFKLPKKSPSNLTTILKPRKFKDVNLGFRKDIFKSVRKYDVTYYADHYAEYQKRYDYCSDNSGGNIFLVLLT